MRTFLLILLFPVLCPLCAEDREGVGDIVGSSNPGGFYSGSGFTASVFVFQDGHVQETVGHIILARQHSFSVPAGKYITSMTVTSPSMNNSGSATASLKQAVFATLDIGAVVGGYWQGGGSDTGVTLSSGRTTFQLDSQGLDALNAGKVVAFTSYISSPRPTMWDGSGVYVSAYDPGQGQTVLLHYQLEDLIPPLPDAPLPDPPDGEAPACTGCGCGS